MAPSLPLPETEDLEPEELIRRLQQMMLDFTMSWTRMEWGPQSTTVMRANLIWMVKELDQLPPALITQSQPPGL